MPDDYKPAGYTSVAPYLLSTNPQRVIDFLVAAFAAEPLRRHARPDGAVMHAEVRIDDTVVMIGGASPDYPPMPAMVHVYVKDADATYRRALAAGATSVMEPKRQGGGDDDLRGGVKDPDGNQWWMATQAG
jgi:PhnB protein